MIENTNSVLIDYLSLYFGQFFFFFNKTTTRKRSNYASPTVKTLTKQKYPSKQEIAVMLFHRQGIKHFQTTLY